MAKVVIAKEEEAWPEKKLNPRALTKTLIKGSISMSLLGLSLSKKLLVRSVKPKVNRRSITKVDIIMEARFLGYLKNTNTTKEIMRGIQEVMSVVLIQNKS